jgi:hypothetical protein
VKHVLERDSSRLFTGKLTTSSSSNDCTLFVR